MRKHYYMMDSYQINLEYVDIIERLNLEKYFISVDGKWSPDFVGFIITEKEIIISFPKHYYSKNYQITDKDISLISKLMIKTRYLSGLDNDLGIYNNFPLTSYLYICNYYKKYGLYNESKSKRQKGYKGKIDWTNTIRKSNKVISGNNLIFLPFIIQKNMSLEVFLTECMVYALNEGFNRFGRYFDVGVSINKMTNNPMFRNKDIVIKQLNLLKSEHFKDNERLLIEHLIRYFKWSNKSGNRTILITKNFENYWEVMVEGFMNSKLSEIKESGELIFKRNSNRYNFSQEIEYIESLEVRESRLSRSFSVEYDHLCIQLDDIAYLFDSKYYKEIRGLDYKQMAYYYILRSSEKYINKQVINGLILPTEKEYHHRVHLDTRDREGLLKDLLIIEHYLNVKKVIKSYVVG